MVLFRILPANKTFHNGKQPHPATRFYLPFLPAFGRFRLGSRPSEGQDIFSEKKRRIRAVAPAKQVRQNPDGRQRRCFQSESDTIPAPGLQRQTRVRFHPARLGQTGTTCLPTTKRRSSLLSLSSPIGRLVILWGIMAIRFTVVGQSCPRTMECSRHS